MSLEKLVSRIFSLAILLLTLSLTHANAQTLSLACTLPATAQVGVSYTGASCTPTGGSPSYTYAISAGTLPGGLSISTTTGAITGTPTTAGSSYSFTIKVTDGEATPQTAAFPVTNFVVAPATLTLSCTLPATAQVGVSYSGASCTPTGGSPSYTYAISAGTLPGGLSISTTTGAITGTPTTAGSSYSFTIKVTDGEATPQTATFPVTNFVVAPAGLTLSCTLPATAQVGVAYTGASCTPTGGSPSYTYSISAGTLPGGLSISTTTGAITGTPTTAGSSYSFTIKVTDGEATPQTATFPVTNFVVAPAGLTLSCTLPATAQVGVAYTGASCTPTGGSPSYTYAISAGTLPTGLSISTTTGAITGTPTTAGSSYSFTIKVTDGEATPQTATFPVTNFVVAPAALTLSCTLPATAQVGVSYTGSSCTPTGGSPSYTYAISAGTLPAGLSISSTTGAITGTPTTAGSNYSFTIKVTDGEATPQTATFPVTNFVVSPPTLTLTCNLPSAQVSVAYSGSCSAAGGTPGYTYSISAGTLPPGLSINSGSGAITGTPTTAGSSYSFTVKVVDSSATPQAATQVFSNFVVAPPTLTLTCTLPATAEVGLNYTGAACTATGGTPGYTFSISSGSLPAGLTISPSTGAISGTPSASGTFSFTVKVSDSGSQSATQVVNNFTVLAALTLTCTAPSSGVVGSSYSANCNAAGGTSPYTYAKASGSLPGGLALNTTNGAITGTLSAAGTFTFTVSVTDTGNPAQTAASQSITVTAIPVLTISTTSLPNAIVGVPYSASCSATGGTTPYTFVTSAGSLPGGLALNATNCAITGTPTASGPFNFAIKVSDSGTPTQQTATQPLSITAYPALGVSTTSVPNGSVGLYYAFTLGTQNGTAPFTWSVVSGTVPPGLTANSTGLINGTPTTVGSYTFTVKVTDSGSPSQSATQTFTGVTIAAGLTITTTSLPSGIVGTSYSATLSASPNGVSPYNWSISGSLPAGLTLNTRTGSITGSPTSFGTFNFIVKVADSSTPNAQVATQALSISIAAVLTLNSSNPFAGGTPNVAYSAACNAAGGTPPYSFAILSGALPPGLSLNGGNCVVNGAPTGSGGTYNFSIRVTDSATPSAQTATQAYSITISAALTIISPASLPSGSVNVAYMYSLVAQNGVTPYGWALISGALPPGLTLTGSGAIAGTPTAAGTYSFTVRVTDSGGQIASQTFSLVVIASAPVVPTFSLIGVPSSQTPGATIGGETISLSSSSIAWPVKLSLGFTPNAVGVSAAYADPAMQFNGSSGCTPPTTTTYCVTIPALTNSVALPSINPGTVAGSMTLTLTVPGQPGAGAASSVTVPASAPIISAGSVQVLNVTSSGFTVELIANSSPRDLKSATFSFNAAGNSVINGTTSFAVDVSSLMTGWYAGATSQQYGSQFMLTVPFTFSGSVSAISSVTVTLTNSVGTSAAATGTI